MHHFNIPIFIPELACPYRCVFCNQYNISGAPGAPQFKQVIHTIEAHLNTFPKDNCQIEVAFFGGSFTGLDMEEQNKYLSWVAPYLESGRINGIRISTRPDYITADILQNLRNSGVIAIELGAQSLNDSVLAKSSRGHQSRHVIEAVAWIHKFGFELGLQMMIGLPGDSPDKSISTAHKIVELGAHTTRIYPCLVIKDTQLAELYARQLYQPISMEDAINQCAQLYLIFENAGVKVLRIGIHPSETFNEGGSLIAGPFHPAFGERVLTRVWQLKLVEKITFQTKKPTSLTVHVNPSQLNAAIGYKAINKKWLQEKFHKVQFVAQPNFKKGQFDVDYH